MKTPPSERAEHIRRLVDAAPPLTEDTRSRLATILRPVASRPLGAAKSAETRSRSTQRAA